MRNIVCARIVVAVSALSLVTVAAGCRKKMDMKPYADRVEAAAAKAEAAASRASDAAQKAAAAASRAEAAAAKVESEFSGSVHKK
jgi:hypothetical protein